MNQGAIGGSLDWEIKESVEFFDAATKAIDALELSEGVDKAHVNFYSDLGELSPADDENEFVDCCYSYFVLVEID